MRRWYGNGRPAPFKSKAKTDAEYEAEGFKVTTMEQLMSDDNKPAHNEKSAESRHIDGDISKNSEKVNMSKPAPAKPIKVGETLDDQGEYIESLHAVIGELRAECERHKATIHDADFYIKKLEAQLAAMTSEHEQLEKVYRMNREWIADAKEREALLLEALRTVEADDEYFTATWGFVKEALEAHAKLVGGNK